MIPKYASSRERSGFAARLRVVANDHACVLLLLLVSIYAYSRTRTRTSILDVHLKLMVLLSNFKLYHNLDLFCSPWF